MIDNIEVFKQNSIRIKAAGKTIYIDPFEIDEEPHDADFVLITHDHYDHFVTGSIEKVSYESTTLVVPEKMEKKAKDVSKVVGKLVTVNPGMSANIEGLEMETVPAYNLLRPFHPKSAGWVGYILNLDGKRIYIAGDTDATKEAKEVKCDVALIPIGGTFTMDAKKAAEFVNIIQPSVVIPVHYGSLVGSPKDGEEFAELVKPPVKVEFKIRF